MPSLRAAGSNRRSLSVLLLVLAVIAVAIAANWLNGGNQAHSTNARLTLVTGQVTVGRADAGSEKLSEGGPTALLQTGDAVTVAPGSSALLTCGDGVRLELEPETVVTLLEMSRAGLMQGTTVAVSLERGSLVGRLAGSLLKGVNLRLETRVATVESSQGVVRCAVQDSQSAAVAVFEGAATVSMGAQSVSLAAGQSLTANLGQPLLPSLVGGGAPPPLAGPTSAVQQDAPTTPAVGAATATPDTLFPQIVTPTRSGDNATLYTVQPGDTLYSIARQHGVSWEALWEANKPALASPELIKVGQRLQIPKP